MTEGRKHMKLADGNGNTMMVPRGTGAKELHDRLGRMLTSTGDAELVEHTTNDHYWADGGDGSGKNRLGALLMQLRAELRAKADRGA